MYKQIILRAKKQIFHQMAGNNVSIFDGNGYNFAELREYVAGDDIRHIDWNISAKMQKPFVKVFHEEREMRVVIASLLSGSLFFGSKVLKQEVLAEVVALLGFSAIKNGNLLQSYLLTNTIEAISKPTKKIHQVEKNIQEIVNFSLINKKVDFDFVAKTLYTRVKRKSLLFLVGDFFDIPKLKLLAKKHEVIVIIVRDKLEENPPPMGFVSFLDPQNGAIFEGDFVEEDAKRYHQKVKEYDDILFKTLKKDGVRFVKVYTHIDISMQLRKLFEGRK